LVWLEPRSDLAHRWQLLHALSVAGPGDRSLAELLAFGRPAKTATLIAITPTAETAWVGTAARNLQGGKMTALLVDPGEFGGRKDQARVSTALTRSGIPHTRMPRALLDEAYASTGWGRQKRPGRLETGRRYLEKGRAAWQNMD
jgi:hypothetical protein